MRIGRSQSMVVHSPVRLSYTLAIGNMMVAPVAWQSNRPSGSRKNDEVFPRERSGPGQ